MIGAEDQWHSGAVRDVAGLAIGIGRLGSHCAGLRSCTLQEAGWEAR